MKTRKLRGLMVQPADAGWVSPRKVESPHRRLLEHGAAWGLPPPKRCLPRNRSQWQVNVAWAIPGRLHLPQAHRLDAPGWGPGLRPRRAVRLRRPLLPSLSTRGASGEPGEPTPAPAGTRRRTGAAPAQAVPAQESQPVAGQRRMGNPGTAAPTSGAPTRRTRMGSGTTAPAPAESAAAPAPFSADPREVKPPRPAWIKPVAIMPSLVVLPIVVVRFARAVR